MLQKTQKLVGIGCISLAFVVTVTDFLRHQRPDDAVMADQESSSVSVAQMDEAQDTHTADAQGAGQGGGQAVSGDDLLAQSETVPAEADEETIVASVQSDTLQIERGKSLAALLSGAGISEQEAKQAQKALTGVYNPKKLKAGQDINITSRQTPDGEAELLSLSFSYDLGKTVEIQKTQSGLFEAERQEKELVREMRRVVVPVKNSLVSSAKAKGVPGHVMSPLIQAFSYDIDFQRDLLAGDRLELVFERFKDPDTGKSRVGQVVYAQINSQNKGQMKLYHYVASDGSQGYYNEKGQSVRKGLMRTPINGARISSHYGHRHHPIQGYTKMHKGVDFAAPTGTPIMAAGDGVVKKAARNRGLGNYIEIKHNSEFSTAYGHLSRFAKDIHPGKKVTQGMVIGYVGNTGMSTGPHLHFEVHKNGTQVNPQTVKMVASGQLTGKALKQFLSAKHQIDQQIARLSEKGHLASVDHFEDDGAA